jgi:ATP-dependent DNA helicase PIF1
VQEVDDNTTRRLVHQDELNLIYETGLPPHKLIVKPGAIATLIKNLDVKAGLVNGTRLRILDVNRDRMSVEIISDFPNLEERIVTLPRVRFLKEISHTLVMVRVQFPIRLAFAVTVNKSQGLTLDKVLTILQLFPNTMLLMHSSFLQVGLFLPNPLTDHGKLYVAMSRVRHKEDLKFCIYDDPNGLQGVLRGPTRRQDIWFTKNKVIRQLWDTGMAAVPPPPKDQRPPPPIAHLEASVS